MGLSLLLSFTQAYKTLTYPLISYADEGIVQTTWCFHAHKKTPIVMEVNAIAFAFEIVKFLSN
jgi:hypothetical protein